MSFKEQILISTNTNLGHSQVHTDIIESNFGNSTSTIHLQSEEAAKPKIQMKIKNMLKETPDSLKTGHAGVFSAKNFEETMEFINSRFERIEKALFSNVD